jgi:hypothetical protein
MKRFALLLAITSGLMFPVALAAQPSNAGLDAQLGQAVMSGDAAKVRDLLSRGANVGYFGPANETPIVTAARLGNKEIVSILLEHGACLGDAAPDYRTPLETALYAPDGDIAAWERTHRDVVWFLLNVIHAAKNYTAYEGVYLQRCAGMDHGQFGKGQWCPHVPFCDLLGPAMDRINFEGRDEIARIDVDALFIIGNIPRRGRIEIKTPEEQVQEIREKRHQTPR